MSKIGQGDKFSISNVLFWKKRVTDPGAQEFENAKNLDTFNTYLILLTIKG